MAKQFVYVIEYRGIIEFYIAAVNDEEAVDKFKKGEVIHSRTIGNPEPDGISAISTIGKSQLIEGMEEELEKATKIDADF